MLVWLHPACSISTLVKWAKSSSSRMVHETFERPFRCQRGYGSFAVQPRGLDGVIRYVRSQREHHALGTIIAPLERTTSPDDDIDRDAPHDLAQLLPRAP